MPSLLDEEQLQRLRRLIALARAGGQGVAHRAQLAAAAAAVGARGPLTVDLSEEPAMVVVRVAPPPDPAFAALTPREREVAELLATGLRNRDIALALGIALGTVKDHVHRVLRKTGLDSRAAVAAAWRGG